MKDCVFAKSSAFSLPSDKFLKLRHLFLITLCAVRFNMLCFQIYMSFDFRRCNSSQCFIHMSASPAFGSMQFLSPLQSASIFLYLVPLRAMVEPVFVFLKWSHFQARHAAGLVPRVQVTKRDKTTEKRKIQTDDRMGMMRGKRFHTLYHRHFFFLSTLKQLIFQESTRQSSSLSFLSILSD